MIIPMEKNCSTRSQPQEPHICRYSRPGDVQLSRSLRLQGHHDQFILSNQKAQSCPQGVHRDFSSADMWTCLLLSSLFNLSLFLSSPFVPLFLIGMSKLDPLIRPVPTAMH